MSRRILIPLAVAAGALGVFDARAFQGRYEVLGANIDGSLYRGQARIEITPGNGCRIVWNAGEASEGVCMRNANSFSVAYTVRGKIGIATYHIMQDGSMQGLFTFADTQGVGRETLVPVR